MVFSIFTILVDQRNPLDDVIGKFTSNAPFTDVFCVR